jgi:ethanolamine ammonia-lyase large subunit
MKITVETEIADTLARELAYYLGMNQEILDDPMEPTREPTVEEVDTWLEEATKEAIVEHFKAPIKAILLKEQKNKIEAIEKGIEKNMEGSIIVGSKVKKGSNK